MVHGTVLLFLTVVSVVLIVVSIVLGKRQMDHFALTGNKIMRAGAPHVRDERLLTDLHGQVDPTRPVAHDVIDRHFKNDDDDSGDRAREQILARALPHSEADDTVVHGQSLSEINERINSRPDPLMPQMQSFKYNNGDLRGIFADDDAIRWLFSPEMKDIVQKLPLQMPEVPRAGVDYNNEERSEYVFSTKRTIVSRG
jgi:hypothetical protein